jgi:hypothetical protein
MRVEKYKEEDTIAIISHLLHYFCKRHGLIYTRDSESEFLET